MKKAAIFIFIFGLFSSLCFSQLTLQFYGGMTHVMSKDINSSIDATNTLLDLFDPEHTGFYDKPCCGANYGAELIFMISKNVGVGIGVEFIRLKSESNLAYDLGTPVVEANAYRINAFPVMVNVHYSLPLTSMLNAFVSVGGGYSFMNIDFTADSLWDFEDLGKGDQIYTFQSHKGSLGIQARWGMEVFLSKNISFLVGGIGRFVKYANIKGDWSRRGQTPSEGSFEESGSSHYLWYYEEPISGKNYSRVTYSENAPSGTVNARKGEIKLSGFSFIAGIKIGLNVKKK